MCSLSDIFRKLSKAFILITVVKVANLSNAKSNCETRMRRGHKSQCCEEENRKNNNSNNFIANAIIETFTYIHMYTKYKLQQRKIYEAVGWNNRSLIGPPPQVPERAGFIRKKNCSCAIRTPLEMNEMCDAARISGYVFVFRHTHTHTFIHGVSIDSISIFTLIYRW